MTNSKIFEFKKLFFNKKNAEFFLSLCSAQEMSPAQLMDVNFLKTKDIVDFAFTFIPFYKKKYSSVGYQLGDLKSEEDFWKLPILEKDEIRQHSQEIVNPEFTIDKLPASTTGGSTGIPLKTYCDPRYTSNIISWRMLNWWGCDISNNSGYLYRNVPKGFSKTLQKVLLYPTRRDWLSAAEMNEQSMLDFYNSMCRIKPKYLVGYVGAIDVFANFLERNNFSLDSLKAIWTTSAPLPEPKRSYLQEIFNTPVYTQYGSCEFYWISAECKKQCGLHIASDIRHIDVVGKDDKALPIGEYGDLVVTDLINYAFPLIRYRLGDRGRLLSNKCDCGLPFPLMDYVHGRISDIIYLPNGEAMPGEYWTTIFDDYAGIIKSFNIHQKFDYNIEVNYEPISGVDCQKAIQAVSCNLTKKVKNLVNIRFVNKVIDVNDNGKTRFVFSEIKK